MPTKTTSVSTSRTIHYEHLKAGLVVYRVETTKAINGKIHKSSETEGFTTQRGLNTLLNSDVNSVDPGTMIDADRVDPVFDADGVIRSRVLQYGFFARENDDLWEPLGTQKPYSLLKSGKAKAEDVIYLNTSNHMLFDCDRLPLPVAIHFDYIGAHIDNGHYNLPRLVEILKARKDIRFKTAPISDDVIRRIPSYNASPDRDQMVEFVWSPSVEVYRKMQAVMAEQRYGLGAKYQVVFDLDLLGLRAGGAALYEDFFESRPVECDPDEDRY